MSREQILLSHGFSHHNPFSTYYPHSSLFPSCLEYTFSFGYFWECSYQRVRPKVSMSYHRSAVTCSDLPKPPLPRLSRKRQILPAWSVVSSRIKWTTTILFVIDIYLRNITLWGYSSNPEAQSTHRLNKRLVKENLDYFCGLYVCLSDGWIYRVCLHWSTSFP